MEGKEGHEQATTRAPLKESDRKFFDLMSAVMYATGSRGAVLVLRNHNTLPYPYNLPGAGWCDAIIPLSSFTYLYN